MSVARLPGGWTLCRVALDERHCDANGWSWGPGDPLWWISDGADSLTVRASCPVAAVARAGEDGWPPKTLRRLGWEYRA